MKRRLTPKQQRFLDSQRDAQVDPWKERAQNGVDRHEFIPLKQVG